MFDGSDENDEKKFLHPSNKKENNLNLIVREKERPKKLCKIIIVFSINFTVNQNDRI